MSKKIMLNGVDYTGVYSIKGNAESAYRTGDVNITPANIGLGNVNNTADSEKSVKYATSAGSASSASKATGLVDYGATTKTIQIGYSGSGISGDEIKYIAGYTTGNGSDVNAKIKNVSKDALKSWLGLGSLAYSSATIPTIPSSLPANGGNSATVNGHTVNSDVPANAKFTDTTYGIATTSTNGLMSKDMVSKLNGIAEGANKTIVDANLSSTSTNPVQNKVVNAALVKKADTISYDKSSSTLYLKSGSTVLSSTEIKSGGGTTITPKPTVNPQIKNNDKKVIITWEDPTDTVIEGSTFSKWAGTKLVMKESGYPTSPDDGTVLVDNTTRDKYKTTGFEKSGLTNDKVYYFALFPYSTDGVYNYDSGNRLLGEPTELKIVTFADGTDAEIAKMIQAHYNDTINIADYWAVGDTRTVSLSAMSATGVGESHRAQTVQLVILDFEHDDLATAINGHSKAAVSIGLKDCLMDASNASNPVNGDSNTENGYMNSSATNAGGWKNCARRAWCNNVFFAALPSTWQSMVKIVNKKSGTGGGSSSGTEITADKIFLAAEIEIFGSRTSSVDGEGTQYQYYKNATANRYKMPKWGSSSNSNIYWERSPYSGYSSSFCYVDGSGGANWSYASNAYGCAPCLCI